jgi:hypothetical protein
VSTIQNDHDNLLNDVSREELKVFSVSKEILGTEGVFREVYQGMNVDKTLMIRQSHFERREATGEFLKRSSWLNDS